MMKYLLQPVLILFATVNLTFAQNNRVFSDQAGQVILLGYGDRSGMESTPFDEWFSMEYDGYQPDRKIIDELQGMAHDVEITIVMGTWCSDSRREVPRFFKILDEIGVTEDQVTIYYVDRDKTCPDIDTQKIRIERVPTFIFNKNDTELGRIIESPVNNLEKDITEILKNNNHGK
ncbi:MAG: thioredoxin family protein [Chlorobi bacterium]|nr:thioredoxin family protein [Chlorobiota bacterium]